MRLGKEIFKLQRRRNKRKCDGAMLEVMMCKVAINFIVFGSFTKNLVVSNLNSSFVDIIHRSRMRKKYSHNCK